MFENKLLLLEHIVVIKKAACGFTNGLVPDASAFVLSLKHIMSTKLE